MCWRSDRHWHACCKPWFDTFCALPGMLSITSPGKKARLANRPRTPAVGRQLQGLYGVHTRQVSAKVLHSVCKHAACCAQDPPCLLRPTHASTCRATSDSLSRVVLGFFHPNDGSCASLTLPPRSVIHSSSSAYSPTFLCCNNALPTIRAKITEAIPRTTSALLLPDAVSAAGACFFPLILAILVMSFRSSRGQGPVYGADRALGVADSMRSTGCEGPQEVGLLQQRVDVPQDATSHL